MATEREPTRQTDRALPLGWTRHPKLTEFKPNARTNVLGLDLYILRENGQQVAWVYQLPDGRWVTRNEFDYRPAEEHASGELGNESVEQAMFQAEILFK